MHEGFCRPRKSNEREKQNKLKAQNKTKTPSIKQFKNPLKMAELTGTCIQNNM